MPFVSFENLIAGWDNGASDTHQYRQASSTNFLSSRWYESQLFTSSQNSGGGYNDCINLTYDPDQGYVAWENSVLANCTGFVHGVWLAYCGWNGTGSYPLNLSLGNGGQYWEHNQTTQAYASGQIPKRGAIICFSQTGGYGHVGVVEKFTLVNNTYTIYIIQSAFAENSSTDSSRTFFGTTLTGTKTSDTTVTWQNQWDNYVVQGFIYAPEEWFDPIPPTPSENEIIFHKVLQTNLPQTQSTDSSKQHIYFTADGANSNSAKLYIKRNNGSKPVPVVSADIATPSTTYSGTITITDTNYTHTLVYANGILISYSRS